MNASMKRCRNVAFTWVFLVWVTGCLDNVVDAQYAALEGGTTSSGDLGVPISCIAPVRDDYITQMGGDPETKKGSIESLQHTILFVFDTSGSMSEYWDDVSKWQAAADAMLFSVSKYSSYVSAGALFFPTDNDCGVDPITADSQIMFTDADRFLGEWEETFAQSGASGSTPMERAFVRADEAIALACEQGIMERPLKVVLLADGQPTCADDLSLMTAYAEKWREHGVMTFVIGLPGSETASDLLEAIANAGGSTQEIVEKRTQSIVLDTDSASAGGGVDTDAAVDTSGIIAPDNEDELEENISMVAE